MTKCPYHNGVVKTIKATKIRNNKQDRDIRMIKILLWIILTMVSSGLANEIIPGIGTVLGLGP